MLQSNPKPVLSGVETLEYGYPLNLDPKEQYELTSNIPPVYKPVHNN